MAGRLTTLIVAIFALAAAAAPSARADALDALLAPTSACPHQTELGAKTAVQVQAMRCMTNYARRHRGLPAFRNSRALSRAAVHKSADILRCDDFSHEACGREFTFWMARFGYLSSGCWSAGENIAWGTGSVGTVRAIFRAWLHSSGHRENILGSYTQLGLGLRVGNLEGNSGAHVWTQEFGSHAC